MTAAHGPSAGGAQIFFVVRGILRQRPNGLRRKSPDALRAREPKRSEVEILLRQSLSKPQSKKTKMKNRQEGAGLLTSGRKTPTYIRI